MIIVLVGIALLLGVALVLSMYDGGLSEVTIDHGDLGLPDRPLTVADLPGLRFRTGVRGYRMEDVDAAIARLGEALALATPTDAASSPASPAIPPAADTDPAQS